MARSALPRPSGAAKGIRNVWRTKNPTVSVGWVGFSVLDPNSALNLPVMANAAKVGLLVVVFVVLLVGGYAVLGKSLFAPPTQVFYADFPDATGVTVGTPVQMAGVDVGAVTAVELKSPRLARVVLSLSEKVQVPTGTEAVIAGSLIGIGNNPIALVAPDAPIGSLAAGATIPGRKLGALDGVIPNTEETVAELTKTVKAIREMLEDPKFKKRTDALLATSTKTIEQFGALAESTDSLLNRNQSQIDRTLQATALAVSDVRRVTNQVALMLERGKLQKDTESIVANLKAITAKTDKLVAGVTDLVNDPELRANARQITASAAQLTETGNRIAANTEKITESGVSISKNVDEITKNGIGISDNVKTITAKAITLTDNANEIAKGAIEIEKKISGTIDKVGGVFQGAKPKTLPITSSIDLVREDDPAKWRTDVSFSYPLSDGKLYLGVFDAFEDNRLIAQFGKPVNSSLDYRYGIYASKPAVGVDYSLAQRVSLRGDLFDINDPRLDLRLKVDFRSGLSGWLGVQRMFDKPTAVLGFGIRR